MGARNACCAYNRIGLCVHHPWRETAGRPYRGENAEGDDRRGVPDLIGPQRFVDGVYHALFPAYDRLEVSSRRRRLAALRVRRRSVGDGGSPQLDRRELQDVLDADLASAARTRWSWRDPRPAAHRDPERHPQSGDRLPAALCGSPSASRPVRASPRSGSARTDDHVRLDAREARADRRALSRARARRGTPRTWRLARGARGRARDGRRDRRAAWRSRCTCWMSTPPSSRPGGRARRRAAGGAGARDARGLAHGVAGRDDAGPASWTRAGRARRGIARGRVRRRHGDLLHGDQPHASRARDVGRDLLLDHAADPCVHRCRRRREP